MLTSNLPGINARRPACNKGRIVGQKRPLKLKLGWAIRFCLELAETIPISRFSTRQFIQHSATKLGLICPQHSMTMSHMSDPNAGREVTLIGETALIGPQ